MWGMKVGAGNDAAKKQPFEGCALVCIWVLVCMCMNSLSVWFIQAKSLLHDTAQETLAEGIKCRCSSLND